jgi:o-succinylbenzoate synthase
MLLVMELGIRHHRLRLHRPLLTARGPITEREVWLLRLADPGGPAGYGEAAPLPGFGGGDPAATAACLAAAPATVEEADLDGFIERWRIPATATAARALVTARLDLAARHAGVPLHRHLGGKGEGRVATALLLPATGRGDAGNCLTFKLKSTGDPDADLHRLRDLAAGRPGCRLRLDANGTWTETLAVRFLAGAAGLPLDFVEQPLPADDIAGHARLHAAGLPIALDEGLAHLPGPTAAATCCRVAVIKPQWWSGDDASLHAWIAGATACGLRVVLSDVLGSAIGRAHTAHLAAALLPTGHHGLGTSHLLRADLARLPIRRGVIHLPARPGLGVEPTGG